jgi:site-specific recombinase XerD
MSETSVSRLRQLPARAARGPERTFRELIPVFLGWLKLARGRSANTVASYGYDLESFVKFCDQVGLEQPDAVTFEEIEVYLGYLQLERGLKAQSASRHLGALRTFWVFLKRRGLAATNPAADCFMLPTQRTLPAYFSLPDQEKILTVLAEDSSLLGRRDYALVATDLFTGLRCAELAALQIAHVDLTPGACSLRVVNGKGGKDREIPIIDRLAEILRGYLAEVRPELVGRPVGCLYKKPGRPGHPPLRKWQLNVKRGGRTFQRSLRTESREEAERMRAEIAPAPPELPFVFVSAHPKGAYRLRRAAQPLTGKTIWNLIRRAVSPIVGRPVHPHMLRHSFATRLYERGGDLVVIRDAMGHASINTTTIYTHLTTNRKRQELARLLAE